MSAPQRVLLTGASGFVAAHVLHSLLEHGFWVRCTVRSQSKASAIAAQYPGHAAQLDFAIVPDISEPGAFDAAVVADPPLDFVVHTASPFHYAVADPERDFLRPAVQGTRGILESVKKHASGVKRVVVTSSFATVLDPTRAAWPGTTFTEADWNPVTWEDGINNHGLTYIASKKFAELEATKFVEEEKPNFDVVILNPPWIFGPVINEQSLDSLNTSTKRISDYILGGQAPITHNKEAWVDGRDLAEAHVAALTTPGAGGQRFIACADRSYFTGQEIVDILRKHFPELHDKIPVGEPGVIKEGGLHLMADNSKIKSVLGIKFRTLEETVVDTANSVLELQKKSKA
ncbi:putative cinnamoyl-CoA reductase [Auricularia subglabra TFB-10046 SS5]|nr:putative cinnamoyl-CoA reductase [Auricularia subglabra TFB-10046 SS5]